MHSPQTLLVFSQASQDVTESLTVIAQSPSSMTLRPTATPQSHFVIP